MKPDSNQFPRWMRWIAQDADGCWWGYEHEPHMADSGWYENEVGLSAKISTDNKNADLKDTLKKINDYINNLEHIDDVIY